MDSRFFKLYTYLVASSIFLTTSGYSIDDPQKAPSPSAELLNESDTESPTSKLLNETTSGGELDDVCLVSESDLNSKTVQALCAKIIKLNERIDDLEASQNSMNNSIESVIDAPSEDLRVLSNFILTGTGYTYYTSQRHRNGTFGTVQDPVFLWRFGDNTLVEMKLDITLAECDTNIQMIFGVFDYVVNDWLTVRVGKYSTPLGFVWEKMTTGWINKLPNLPLPYNPRVEALTPAAEVGIDIRGAVPFENLRFDCENKIPFVLNYDLWLGNGPDESKGRIRFGCNYNNNNHNIAYGSRIGFRFQPACEIGMSGEWGQWNNNHHTNAVTIKKHMFYKALVLDLHWRFKNGLDILGECMYTSFGAVPNKAFGIHSYDVKQVGGWLQASAFLCSFYTNPCFDPTIWENFEGVVRYGFVNSGISDFSGEQWSFGLNYYFSNRVIWKAAYDINNEKRLRWNAFTTQLAYAY